MRFKIRVSQPYEFILEADDPMDALQETQAKIEQQIDIIAICSSCAIELKQEEIEELEGVCLTCHDQGMEDRHPKQEGIC